MSISTVAACQVQGMFFKYCRKVSSATNGWMSKLLQKREMQKKC